MPRLRSQVENTVVMKKVVEQSQWVMIAPSKLMQNEEEGTFCKMPHPQNGVENLFLFKTGGVYQLMRCQEKYRSWFIDNSVQKDGSMFMITPIDPLFLALPYLERSSVKDKYVPLDNILVEENYQLAMLKLEECLTKKSLFNICNCKGSDDLFAYKADESKILAWLSLKAKKLASHLSKSDVQVDQSTARVRNMVQLVEKSEEDCIRYAWMVVSDYLTSQWSEKLRENLNIKELAVTVKPAIKKQKLNDSTSSDKLSPVEDYRDHSKTKESTKPKAKLMSSGNKALQKVDKKGMKTMSSFFTSKTKK